MPDDKIRNVMPMTDGEVRLVRNGRVATILFDRPQARNAMTWHMYEGLAAACEQLRADTDIRVAVLRGVGGKAFIAGTDISQFKEFSTAEHGLAYEAKMEAYLTALNSCRCRRSPRLGDRWWFGDCRVLRSSHCDARQQIRGSDCSHLGELFVCRQLCTAGRNARGIPSQENAADGRKSTRGRCASSGIFDGGGRAHSTRPEDHGDLRTA